MRPWTLTAAAVIEAIEGLVAFAAGAFVAVQTVVGTPYELSSAIFVAVFGLVGGAGLLVVARGLLVAKRWSRAPAVLTQLLAAPVAFYMIQSAQYGWGVPLLAAAVVALMMLFAAPTLRALT